MPEAPARTGRITGSVRCTPNRALDDMEALIAEDPEGMKL